MKVEYTHGMDTLLDLKKLIKESNLTINNEYATSEGYTFTILNKKYPDEKYIIDFNIIKKESDKNVNK